MGKFYRLLGKGCKLVGCGSAVPKLLISNDDLAQIVDTSDEWISVRTGIRNRRILSGTVFFFFFVLFLFYACFPHICNICDCSYPVSLYLSLYFGQ